MTGISTYKRLAVLRCDGGIDMDTYDSLVDLVRAQAYRLCAQHRGSTATLTQIYNEVVADVERDWSDQPAQAEEP